VPRIIRKHHPPYSKDYTKYKPYLRQDFNYRCAYCTIHEGEFGGLRNFAVEHFRPKWKFPELECEYTNLYYACCVCNDYKGRRWPSDEDIAEGLRFSDSCEEDIYEVHFCEQNDGRLKPLTVCGDYTITHIRLNRLHLVRLRLRRRNGKAKIHEVQMRINELDAKLSDVEPNQRQSITRELELLKGYLQILDEQFVSPRIPYEEEDLQNPHQSEGLL